MNSIYYDNIFVMHFDNNNSQVFNRTAQYCGHTAF